MTLTAALLLLLQVETATTEHYEVVSTLQNPEYVKHVAETLEAAYPALISVLGEKVAETERYRINLYATPDEYLAMDRKLNNGRLASFWAFSHVKTGESYLLIQPRDAMLPLPDKFRALLRHEAFHLVSFRHAPRQGRAAPWLEEGLCELAAEEADRVKGADPLATSIKFSHAVQGVRTMRKEARFIPLGWLLEENPDSYASDLKIATWYQEAWLFVKYMKERREKQWTEFRARFRQAGEPSGEEPRIQHVKQLLLESLGEPLGDVEKDWLKWIDGLKPASWWRIADGGDWRLTKDTVEGAAYNDRATYLISSETFKGERYRFRTEVQVMAGGLGQVDLLLTPELQDRDAGNLVKAVLMRGGDASILARRNGEWVNLANRKFDGKRLAPEKWLALELEVSGRTVRLKAGGEVAVEHTFEDKVDELHHVRWGLGNYDSWTRFRAIEIKKD